jgi:outer membrane protein assembly factor BamD
MVRCLVVVVALALTAGCARNNPPEFEEVASAEVLYRQGIEVLEKDKLLGFLPTKDYDFAIETFQAIVDNYPYSDYSVLAELKIADTYYEQGKWEEALSYYRDFAELHPTHERVPYSVLRSAQSRRSQALNANRDQTNTKRALEHLDVLLTRYPYTTEAQEAEQIWREMRTRLAEHEMGVGDFYMSHEEFQSAADRFRKVLNDFPGLGLDGQALFKLGTCYSEMNLDDEATRIFEVILHNYDGTEYAEAAREHVPAAN